MYNRYIRNDNGEYHRVPHQETSAQPEEHRRREQENPGDRRQASFWREEHRQDDSKSQENGFLRKILDRLKLEEIDTGDLLLLLLLLLLFSEGEDDELLIALGLLLIL